MHDLGSRWFSLSSAFCLQCRSPPFPREVREGPGLLACGLCHSGGPDRPEGWALEGGPCEIRPWGPLAVQDSAAVDCQTLSGTMETGYEKKTTLACLPTQSTF